MDSKQEPDKLLGWKIEESELAIRPDFEFDAYSAEFIKGFTLEQLEANMDVTTLHLDLSEVKFIDSTGVGVIIGFIKRLRSRDGAVYLTATDRYINKVFEIVGINRLAEIKQGSDDSQAAGYNFVKQADYQTKIVMRGIGKLAQEIHEGNDPIEVQKRNMAVAAADFKRLSAMAFESDTYHKVLRKSSIEAEISDEKMKITILNGSNSLSEKTMKIFERLVNSTEITSLSLFFPIPSYIQSNYAEELIALVEEVGLAGKSISIEYAAEAKDVVPQIYNRLVQVANRFGSENI